MEGAVFRENVLDLCAFDGLCRGLGTGYEPVGFRVCGIRASGFKIRGRFGRALYVCGADGKRQAGVCQIQQPDFFKACDAGQQCFVYHQLYDRCLFSQSCIGTCGVWFLRFVRRDSVAGNL